MKKWSKIWSVDTDTLQEMVDRSTGLSVVLRELGINSIGGSWAILKRRVEEEDIDTSKMKANQIAKKRKLQPKQRTEDILVENSTFNRTHLKERLLREKLLDNRCSKCNMEPKWNGEPLTMVLDHINGVNNDNRLGNLRMLCPNCNSQTKTFAGRNSNGVGKRIGRAT